MFSGEKHLVYLWEKAMNDKDYRFARYLAERTLELQYEKGISHASIPILEWRDREMIAAVALNAQRDMHKEEKRDGEDYSG